jgi:hypothetical protein
MRSPPAAGLSLADLQQIIAGVKKLEAWQLAALARKLGDRQMSEQPKIGTSIFRERARILSSGWIYSNAAADIGIPSEKFLAFAEGRADLPEEILQKLAKRFVGNASFEAARDLSVGDASPAKVFSTMKIAPAVLMDKIVFATPAGEVNQVAVKRGPAGRHNNIFNSEG